MTEETARPGTRERPFAEVWPRSHERDQLVFDLATPAWKIALVALYLSTGRYASEQAKHNGCSFGFCDEHGVMQPARDQKATYVGWTLDGPADSDRERIRRELRPWKVEDTDGWGTWCVTLAWPGDREQAEGWGATADEALNMATTRLFRAGWRANMSPETAALLLEQFGVIEAKESSAELAEMLGRPEPAIVTTAVEANVAELTRHFEEWRRGGAPLLVHGEGVRIEMRPVDAHEVTDGMLVRDSAGDYLLRYGPFAHVAYAIGVREEWRSWAPPLMHWPRVGRFEVVARDLAKETPAEELRQLAEKFEAVAGKVTVWDPSAVVASAREVRDADP